MTVGTAAYAGAMDLRQLGSLAFWAQPIHKRLDDFALLRDRAPVHFHSEGLRKGTRPGFGSVTRHADVAYVSRTPEIFSSASGFTIDDLPAEMREVLGSMIAMDDPRRQRLRRLVLSAFSARVVNDLEPAIRRRASTIVDTLIAQGECDFVATAAGPFPLQVICDLLDIPVEFESQLRKWTDEIVGVSDPRYANAAPRPARGRGMHEFAIELGKERRANPGNDLVSALMAAEIDGESLSAAEFGAFMVLLIAAGNETTRTSLTWGLSLLSQNPGQRALLWDDFGARARNAVDEIVRWCSPVQHMRRTALVDTQIGDAKISAGEKVVMWYGAANHDESVFPDARAFDITRPNAAEHVGFGAGGPHHCLGAALARLEIRVLLEEIRRRAPSLHATAEPTLLLSAFANGVTELPCSVHA